MSDVLDRLSSVSTLKEKIVAQDRVLEGMQRLMLDQRRELAELKGLIRGYMAVQRPDMRALK